EAVSVSLPTAVVDWIETKVDTGKEVHT
ncbi:MAG: hypothetical protein J07HQX50_01184, partial [Haloquadratum sp. J07HQX50]